MWKLCKLFYVIYIFKRFLIILALINQEEWEFLDFISYEAKINYLLKFSLERLAELRDAFDKDKDDKSPGYVDRVIVKVLDNLHVNFKNIHIRIEEPNKAPLYSLGITLEEMIVVNTNEKWEEKFIDRNKNKNINVFKLLKITNFGIYLIVNETYFITNESDKDKIRQEMNFFFPVGTSQAKVEYLVKPISLTAKMRQNNEFTHVLNAASDTVSINSNNLTARINLWINLNNFDIEIQKTQFDCLIKIINHISNYQRFQFNYYETRKYRAYRPIGAVKENSMKWFKYAITMIIKRRRFIQGEATIFELPLIKKEILRNQFATFFSKFYRNADSLSKEESEKFKSIVECIEIQDLYLWAKPVLQEVYKETKKEENKKQKSGLFKKMFGSKVTDEDLLSKEDEEKIDEILEIAVKEATNSVINADSETKMQIEFKMNEGSFKFSKMITHNNLITTEGFSFLYKDLIFSMKKGEYFIEIDSELKDFVIEMFTTINNNITTVPITFKSFKEEIKKNNLVRVTTVDNYELTQLNSQGSLEEEQFVWKLNFRKNAPNEEINSKLYFQINTLNILYHQALLERIISFFTVQVNEDIAIKAWDKLEEIKESTQASIKEALNKKNIIELKIEPRKIIVPINKYDLKNSRMLVVDIGKMSMYNADGDDTYPDRYNLEVSKITLSHFHSFIDMRFNRNGFQLLSDASANLSFAMLNPALNPHKFAKFKLFITIDKISIHINEHLFATLIYIIDIFKPAREIDLWSQLNQDKNEIKKNCKIFAKILKKSEIYRNWEEYFAVLSGGYIYFYKNIDDEEYLGYFYIKDSEMMETHEEPFGLIIKNKYGLIELKFQNESKKRGWMVSLTERINEMKYSYEVNSATNYNLSAIDMKEIYFGMECNVKELTAYLHNDADNKTLFAISLNNFTLLLGLCELDTELTIYLQGLKIVDELRELEEFYQVLDSTDPDDKDLKLVALNIIVCYEGSPKYKGVQIELDIKIGYLYAIWNPIVIRRLLGFLAHNDILRHKVLREIELTADDKFIQPVKDESSARLFCTEHKYTYVKLTTSLKKVRIVWVQPILNIMFIELRLSDLSVNLDMFVDHFTVYGEVGNAEIFDLSNHPYTIKKQEDFHHGNIREILGAKKGADCKQALISYEYTAMNTWCVNCKDNYTTEAYIKINSVFLIYVQEHFMRFFNYLMGEFLGALGPSEEVRLFRNEKNLIKVQNDREIEFMKLNVNLSNPQGILKPRPGFKEFFLVDFGNVSISAQYCKVYNKLRNSPVEYRWNSSYHFNLNNFYITTHDNFSLFDPTDGLINMHFPFLTESDLKLDDVECDKSYQIDILFNKINVNLRQCDFLNLMKCIDLNILYTDEQEDDYNYERLKKIPLKVEENITYLDEVLDKYFNMLIVLLIPNISVKLYNENEPFSEVIFHEMQLNFLRKLNWKKEILIAVKYLEMYHFTDNKREAILSDFTRENKLNEEGDKIILKKLSGFSELSEQIYQDMLRCKILAPRLSIVEKNKESNNSLKNVNNLGQLDLRIIIDKDREKSYMISLNNLRFIVRIDAINLLKQFFLEGFPFYAKNDSDLPNLYDANEENNPGMRVYLEIKNPLFCILTDQMSNKNQDLICLSSDIVVGYKVEKIAKVKNELYYNYCELKKLKAVMEDQAQKEHLDNAIINDKCDIYSLSVSLFEVCPFICDMKNVLLSQIVLIPKRKIMENFMFSYVSKTQMQYVPPNNYVLCNDSKLDLNKMTLKTSYRDLVLFLKSIEYNNSLIKKDYEDKLKSFLNYSKVKAEFEASELNEIRKTIAIKEEQKNNPIVSNTVGKINQVDGESMTDYDFNRLDSENANAFECEEPININLNTHFKPNSSRNIFEAKDQIIDKGISKTIIISQGLQLILIDDHANTYYPFISFIVQELSLNDENLNYNQKVITANIVVKVLTYNIIAGMWEPLIEKTHIHLEVTKDNADEKVNCTTININIPVPQNKPHLAFNINLSDLNISFLYSATKSWIDKYFKLKNNYDEEIKKLIQNDRDMNITNHTVFNYTGRPLTLFKLYKSNKLNFSGEIKKLGEVPENHSHDIEYFDEVFANDNVADLNADIAQNLLKENYICFELDGAKAAENILKIDNMQTRTHSVDYINLKKKINISSFDNKYDFIVSQIKFNELRKFIYFYSPLSFKNKTSHLLVITLVRKNLSNFFMFLESKATIGIPYEYMEGDIEFVFEDSPARVFPIKKFLFNNSIQEEIKFKNICFNLFYRPSEAKYKLVSISSSYCIRNCLPFDIEVIITKTNDVFYIKKGERVFTDSLSLNDNLTIKISFLQFRSCKTITLYDVKEPKLSVLYSVKDNKNNGLQLMATIVDGDTRTVVLHANGLVINNTLMEVKFYYGKGKNKNEVAGQGGIANVFCVSSSEKYLSLDSNGFVSDSYSITAIGISTLINCKKKDKVLEFIMQCELSLLAQDLDLYCNIITICPRFILYNQLNYPILVSLYDDGSECEILRSYQKIAFYFFGKGPDSDISLRLLDDDKKPCGSKWNSSCAVSLLSDGLLTIPLSSIDSINKKFINIEKKIDNASTFVVIRETNYESCQFFIENFSSNISCRVWQYAYDQSTCNIDVKSKSIFAWSNYRAKKTLCVQFFIGSLNSRPIAVSDNFRKYEIEDDRVIFISSGTIGNNTEIKDPRVYPASELVYLKTSFYSGFTVKVIINTDGIRKSLKITDITHDVSRVTSSLTTLIELSIKIEKLGISLIGDNKNIDYKKGGKYKRNEIVYICFKDILFYNKSRIVDEFTRNEMQCKVQDIEIDNEYSYITQYPIIVRPVHSEKFLNKEKEKDNKEKDKSMTKFNSSHLINERASHFPPFFNCAIFLQKKKGEEVTKIILLNYLIQSFVLGFDSNVLEALLNFFTNLTIEMKTSLTYINPVFEDHSINAQKGIFIKENYFDPLWLQKMIIIEKAKLFIQTLETSPMEIILSFTSQSKDKVFQRLLISNPILSSVLSSVSTIENVPIMLNGSQMHNVYGSWSEIIANIMYEYKQSALVQVMKIFGAIDILGNPLNLLHSLGTGVKDFFQKPAKGIVKGPLEGAKGVLDGSLSLVKHTVEGTFTTTSKITSGISKGILYITQDDEYINEREKKKITERPKNFVEGIGYGISSMAGGIFYGVTDIVMKPIEGAKKEKWAGLGKGLLKGFAGVVVKPISGVLELVSKTTEGIKNTVNTDGKFKMERMPRPFYGKYKFIKSYNAYHANVIEIMHNRIDHFKHKPIDFYSSEIYKNKKEDNILMVFSTTSMHLIDLSRRELKSVLNYMDIKDIYLESNTKVRILFSRELNGKKHTSISFYKHQSSAQLIYNKIKDAIENNYEEKI